MGIKSWFCFHNEVDNRHDYVFREHENCVNHEMEYFCERCGKRFFSSHPLFKKWDTYWFKVLKVGERREVDLKEIQSHHIEETGGRYTGRNSSDWGEPKTKSQDSFDMGSGDISTDFTMWDED